jgi:hypothetical protein
LVTKTAQDRSSEIVEQGDIYFLYRPKVRPEDADQGERPGAVAEDLGDAAGLSASCSDRRRLLFA